MQTSAERLKSVYHSALPFITACFITILWLDGYLSMFAGQLYSTVVVSVMSFSADHPALSFFLKLLKIWTLLLSPHPAAQPQSVGLIAGTIATGVLAVIICSLLVVVTLFYWKNKNKYDEEEIPNEIRFVTCANASGQCSKKIYCNTHDCLA